MLLIFGYCLIQNVLLIAAENAKISQYGTSVFMSPTANGRPIQAYNMTTYMDKAENLLRIPDINKNYEEHRTKQKNFKKSPKRTVQKIIKKIKSRRKLYINQATSIPTKLPTNGDEIDRFYAQEELMQKNDNLTTNQANHQKKRKWNTRVSRYPMPFQHLSSKKDSYRRNKRSDDREDVFIFTDLDEMQFLKEGDDENVVNAHIKKYW